MVSGARRDVEFEQTVFCRRGMVRIGYALVAEETAKSNRGLRTEFDLFVAP